MIMKAIRTSVFIAAILLGVAATATVSAWSGKYTGLRETAIPNDAAVWDQRAWVYWRNHNESSVELNYTSQRIRYISGTASSAYFTAYNKVMNSKSKVYYDERASLFELSTGESWRRRWAYGGGTGINRYITASKANDSATVITKSRYSSPHSLTQEIWFYNDDDGDPTICMDRSSGAFQTTTGPASDCP